MGLCADPLTPLHFKSYCVSIQRLFFALKEPGTIPLTDIEQSTKVRNKATYSRDTERVRTRPLLCDKGWDVEPLKPLRHNRWWTAFTPSNELSSFSDQTNARDPDLRLGYSTSTFRYVYLSPRNASRSYFLSSKLTACFLASPSAFFFPCPAMEGLMTFCI